MNLLLLLGAPELVAIVILAAVYTRQTWIGGRKW